MVGSLALRAPSRRGRRLGAVLGVVALTAISVQLTTAAPGSADAFEVTPAPSWTNQSFSPDGDQFVDQIEGAVDPRTKLEEMRITHVHAYDTDHANQCLEVNR